MLQIKPVASATPNGDYQVDRRFRIKLQTNTNIEDAHRQQIIRKVTKRIESVENARRWLADGIKNTVMVGSVETIGLRKDAAIRNGNCFRRPGKRYRPSYKQLTPIELIETQIWRASADRLRNHSFDLHRIGNPREVARLIRMMDDEYKWRKIQDRCRRLDPIT